MCLLCSREGGARMGSTCVTWLSDGKPRQWVIREQQLCSSSSSGLRARLTGDRALGWAAVGVGLSPGVGSTEQDHPWHAQTVQPPGCPGLPLRLPEVLPDVGWVRARGAAPCAGATASPLMLHTPQRPSAAGEGQAVPDGEIRAKASRATSGLVATDSHTSGSM